MDSLCIQKRMFSAAAGVLLALSFTVSADYDVVVYGATPSGIAAAVEAGREGYSVALYEHTTHIGGLTAGGLSNTDFRSFQSLGGAWKDFMDSVLAHYVSTYGEGSQQVADAKIGAWYEPKVAKQVFENMLSDAGVTVFTQHELVSVQTTAAGSRTRIVSMTTRRLPDSAEVVTTGRVFIDGTYEGDLMAASGNRFYLTRVMAYNFRLLMTTDPDNQIAITDTKPDVYETMDFSALRTYLLDNTSTPLDRLVKIRTVPNDKAEFNDIHARPYHYTISGEGWSEGSFPYREAMFSLAKATARGFLYFLATDEALADHPIQTDVLEWGYAADEYVDTDNFTPVLYIREGRRMVGDYRMTSADQVAESGSERSPAMADAVAIGDYIFSAHGNVNDYGLSIDDFLDPSAPTANDWGTPLSDGNSGGGTPPPYPIAYGAIVPSDVEGLLVSVAVSADRRAYSTIRMEPSWTALGQAAGAAAALALDNGVEVRDVDITKLQLHLHARGAKTIYVSDVDADSPCFEAVQYLGNHGLFQNTSLIGSDSTYRAPVPLGNTQWHHAWRWHDVRPGLVLSEEVETYWREQYTAAFGADALTGFDLSADGTLTRGEYLLGLYEHLNLEPPVTVRDGAARGSRESTGQARAVPWSPRFSATTRELRVATFGDRDFRCTVYDLRGATVTEKHIRGRGEHVVTFGRQGTYVAVLNDMRDGGVVDRIRITVR